MRYIFRLFKTPSFLFGFIVFFGIISMALLAPIVSSKVDVLSIGLYDSSQSPSLDHILGTNSYGQDVFSRLLFGLRSSLFVGLLSAIIATFLGTIVGLVSGYKGGKLDDILSGFTNLFTVLPSFFVIILVSSVLEKRSLLLFSLIIGFITWSWTARAVRVQVAAIKTKEHISIAKLNGFGTLSILIRQILPYMASYVFMAFIVQMATGILNEAAISMIGLGPYDTVTLGMILNDAYNNESIINGAWWVFLPATFAITLLQFSLYIMNSSLESFFNPRLVVSKGGKH